MTRASAIVLLASAAVLGFVMIPGPSSASEMDLTEVRGSELALSAEAASFLVNISHVGSINDQVDPAAELSDEGLSSQSVAGFVPDSSDVPVELTLSTVEESSHDTIGPGLCLSTIDEYVPLEIPGPETIPLLNDLVGESDIMSIGGLDAPGAETAIDLEPEVPGATDRSPLDRIRLPDAGTLVEEISASAPYVVIGAAQAGLAATLWVHLQESLHWLWTQAFVPLFSRLRREFVLENRHRERICAEIRSNQGIFYSDLLRRLEITNGLLSFHLRKLEEAGIVTSYRSGGRRHLVTSDFQPVSRSFLTSGRQRQILGYLGSVRGAYQEDIADALCISRSTVSYNLRSLTLMGLVHEKTMSRRRLYSVRAHD